MITPEEIARKEFPISSGLNQKALSYNGNDLQLIRRYAFIEGYKKGEQESSKDLLHKFSWKSVYNPSPKIGMKVEAKCSTSKQSIPSYHVLNTDDDVAYIRRYYLFWREAIE